MSARGNGAGLVEKSLLHTVECARLESVDAEPDARHALTAGEESELVRAADVGDVLVRMLDADALNQGTGDGERLDDRQRAALLACVGYAFGKVEDVLAAVGARRDRAAAGRRRKAAA